MSRGSLGLKVLLCARLSRGKRCGLEETFAQDTPDKGLFPRGHTDLLKLHSQEHPYQDTNPRKVLTHTLLKKVHGWPMAHENLSNINCR